jgi:hypothetical protein
MSFKQGDLVEFDIRLQNGSIKGIGEINGVSSTEQAVIGHGYVIRLFKKVKDYNFSHMVLFENQLKLLNSDKNDIEEAHVIVDLDSKLFLVSGIADTIEFSDEKHDASIFSEENAILLASQVSMTKKDKTFVVIPYDYIRLTDDFWKVVESDVIEKVKRA